jgi:tetratricopeptide (TPR) repeat protein
MPSTLLLLGLLVRLAEPAAPVSVSWEPVWKKAFERARSEHRLVLVDYFASWCGPCKEMDHRVFPDPRVAPLLQQFVLLKVDADRGFAGVTTLPTYKVFDPWETDRLTFVGFQEPETFARKLSFAIAAQPDMVGAAESLKEKDSVEARQRMGHAYLVAHAPSSARDEFDRARKLSKRAGDLSGAQVSEIAAASTWIWEGEAPKALKLLQKIAETPVGPDCGARAWLGVGDAKRQMQDMAGAVEAYRRALATCPEGSALRQSIETAIAQVEVKN